LAGDAVAQIQNPQPGRRTTDGAAAPVSTPTPKSSKTGTAKSRPSPGATNDYSKLFESDDVKPETIRALIEDLSAAKQHDDVIRLIEQALLAGKSQPWMYEVLALTMEAAGRPREQIERVLLSSRDLIPADGNSLLFLAAYLARFERYPQAIKCCRQAADLEPTRPEPYVEMLRFAQKSKDFDAMAWASIGVLTYVWGKQQGALHEQARTAATEVQAEWKKSGRLTDLVAYQSALAEAERIDLKVRLEWSGAGDLDLVVDEPSGTVCSRETPYSPGGGVLTHDGHGPKTEECYDEYVCPLAFSGEFRVRVRYSWGTIVGKRAQLIVTRGVGTPQEHRDVMPIAVTADDVIVRVSLKDGRRQRQAAIVPARHQPLPSTTGRVTPTVLQQLSPAVFTSGQVTPFVTGAQPTAGGGGVGYQPVVQFINEGATLAAMAVVSGDRRYVRLTVSPTFNNITDVFTFSFVR